MNKSPIAVKYCRTCCNSSSTTPNQATTVKMFVQHHQTTRGGLSVVDQIKSSDHQYSWHSLDERRVLAGQHLIHRVGRREEEERLQLSCGTPTHGAR